MSNEQKMKDFINALLKEYYPDLGDIDGGTFQDIAEQHGILIAEIRHQPCGEFCNCNEVVYDEEWIEGVKCFRPANWLSAQHSAHPTKARSPSAAESVQAQAVKQNSVRSWSGSRSVSPKPSESISLKNLGLPPVASRNLQKRT